MRSRMWDEKRNERLSILRACDHFRKWQSLDDERVCVVCNRGFNGHEVPIVMIDNDYKLHCPTATCDSGVHQWVYQGNPLLSDVAYADWWRALGSTDSTTADPNQTFHGA
jgi:hypothetical protein